MTRFLCSTNLPSAPERPRALEVFTTNAGADMVRVILIQAGKIVHTRPIPGTVKDAIVYAKAYFERH